MRFEKLNNDKIKVVLSSADLRANDIDFHSFMSNSDETKTLFLEVLDKAERDYGFNTDNYKLKVETLALDNGSFILTITRSKDASKDTQLHPIRKKFKVSRKIITPSHSSKALIYNFNNFDDFCSFTRFLLSTNFLNIDKVSKVSTLYTYNDSYYLILTNTNVFGESSHFFYSSITEFATYIEYSKTFVAKLYEGGKLLIKSNAIKVCNKYFV